jgi:hypothetical protein
MSRNRGTVESMTPTAAEVPPVSRPRWLTARRLAIRLVYGLLSLWTLMMSLGVVMLAVGDVPEGPYGFAAASTTAWKLLSLGGYLVIAWTGGRSVLAVQWVLLGDLTWLVADLISPQEPSESVLAIVARNVLNALLFLGPWFVLAPERRQAFHLRVRPDRPAAAMMGLATPALAYWVWHNAALHIPTIDGNSGPELEFDLTGLPLVLIAVGLFAALSPQGERWPLLLVAAGAVYIGIGALLTPTTDVGTPGHLGGLACLLGAGLLAGRHWSVRRRSVDLLPGP